MSVIKGLANPAVRVNNELFDIKPNSWAAKAGKGEMNMRSVSSGGRASNQVVTVNAETLMAEVKFTLVTTVAAKTAFRKWQEASRNGEPSKITKVDEFGNDAESFNDAFVLEDTEIPEGQDADFVVMFKGAPLI